MDRIKIGLATSAVAGWGLFAYQLHKDPVTVDRIVTQEKIVHVDRVVTKDVVKTVTKPDGTRVVVETKFQDRLVEKEVLKSESRPQLSRYSLGLSVRPSLSLPETVYSIHAGKRIGQSPFWVTGSFGADQFFGQRHVTLGVTLEF